MSSFRFIYILEIELKQPRFRTRYQNDAKVYYSELLFQIRIFFDVSPTLHFVLSFQSWGIVEVMLSLIGRSNPKKNYQLGSDPEIIHLPSRS